MYSCFHSVGLPEYPVLEVIRMVAEAGYSAIELNAETLPWAQPHITPAADAATRQAVVDACRQAGLTIPAVGAHIGMVSGNQADRDAAIAFVNGCTDLAKDVGSPLVHILSGPLDDSIDRADGWAWFRKAVEETTEYATERGIVLAIEAIAGHLFHKVDDYHTMRRELPGVPFKVNFDPSHLVVQGEDPIRIVHELGDQIVHVHLKDGKGSYPKFEFPPLGKGTIDFDGLVEGLRTGGYNSALSVEYEAQVYGYKDSEGQILAEGKGFVDRLLKKEQRQ